MHHTVVVLFVDRRAGEHIDHALRGDTDHQIRRIIAGLSR